MNGRHSRIQRLVARAERVMAKSAMRRDVEDFFRTGRLPESEPARSFVLLMQSFEQLADSSIGGDDFDFGSAERHYKAAVAAWERGESEIKWT